jgi:hypothetical protein
MKRCFLFLFFGIIGFTLTAQKTQDVLVLSGRYGLPASYKDTYSGETPEWGALNSLTYGTDVVPNTKWVINVNHFYFNVPGVAEIPESLANPMVLNGIIVRTGVFQSFGNASRLQVLVAPRLMSDFQNLDGNSFQLGGILAYVKEFHQDLSLGFGAVYNQELYGPYMLPICILDWNLSDKWNIKGDIPITTRIKYQANDNLAMGLNYFGLTTSFYLGDEAYAGDYIERFSVDLSLFARQRLFGNFYIEGMAGRTMGRNYKQYTGDQKVDFAIPLVTFGDNRTVKNVRFNDGIILQAKLILNMPIPE